jgi:hypothetical protein
MNVTGMSLSIISIGMFALLCIPNDSADAPSETGNAPIPPTSISTRTRRPSSGSMVCSVTT